MKNLDLVRRRRAGQGGASTVETAMVLIVLIMMSLGIAEFGRAVWVYTTLSNGTRAAIRFAVVRGQTVPATDSQIATIVARNTPGLTASNLQVTTTYSPDRRRGSTVTIRVRYPFRFAVSPALGPIPATLQLQSKTSGIIQY